MAKWYAARPVAFDVERGASVHVDPGVRAQDRPMGARAPSSQQCYRAFRVDYRARLAAGRGVGFLREILRSRSHSGREYLRSYLRWLRPHRRAIGTVLGLALTATGLQMAEPLFMRFIIDRVLLNDELDPGTRLTRLHLAGALFLVVTVAASLIGLTQNCSQRLLNVRVMLSLRRSVFEHLLRLPLARLTEMKTGGILSRVTADVDMTAGLLPNVLLSSVSSMRLLIAVVALISMNWQLAIAAVAVIPGAIFVSVGYARRIRPVYRAMRQDLEQIDGRVGEVFSGIRVVRAFRGERRELSDYMRRRHAVLRKELFAHRRELALWTFWGLLVSGVSIVIVWYGGYLQVAGRASIGDILATQWYSVVLLSPIWQMINTIAQIQRSLAAVERVFDVLTMPPDKPDKPDACDAPQQVHEIRFDGVDFEYQAGQLVIRDLDVRVPGGALVALVGRSGAGKTTITNLVARFHDPTRGRILVNGIDIREFRLKSYRGLFAIVQQDVFLFDGSVRDNIAYGRHKATDHEVENAARQANAHEFILRLPEQYDTFIGERGVKLSAGQQQRLAIARAILAAPQILILDEATSNLDTESEQSVQTSMSTLVGGRITFVIAHRLSTIRRADLILVVDDGRVIERGSHDELMRVRSVYHKMVSRQMQVHSHTVAEAWQ